MNFMIALFNNPTWVIICAVVGMLVGLVCCLILIYALYHIARGFVLACSFMLWSARVMKLNGRTPQWRGFISVFLSAWFRGIGYVNNGSETISQGRSVWRGYGDHNAFEERASQFVTCVEPKYTAKNPAKPKAKRSRVPQHKPRPALVPLHELRVTDYIDDAEIERDDVGEYFHKMANDAADEDTRGHDFEALQINAQLDEEDAELQKMVAGGPRTTPRVQKQVKRKHRK